MNQVLNNIDSFQPIYRILNREENLNFFRDILGMKVLSEENAQVFIGGHEAKEIRFQLEESPGLRPVNGLKKHYRTVIKVEQGELEQLLSRSLNKVSKVYHGEKGYAFEAVSPENDLFLLTSGSLSTLSEIEKAEVSIETKADFTGLSDFVLTDLELNVNSIKTEQFLSKIFSVPSQNGQMDLSLVNFHFHSAGGENTDLNVSDEETLDLEVLIFNMNEKVDLADVAKNCSDLEKVYLDKVQKTLSIILPNQIGIWLVK